MVAYFATLQVLNAVAVKTSNCRRTKDLGFPVATAVIDFPTLG